MNPTSARHLKTAGNILVDGLAAGLLSGGTLLWRGKQENRSAPSTINAVSHWLWGREALRRDDTTASHTAVGAAIHQVSAMLWATVYGVIRANRRQPTAANAIGDAVAVTALAAVVDLKMVPKRLTPGFEERLSNRSLLMVYGTFAAGLALGGLAQTLGKRRYKVLG